MYIYTHIIYRRVGSDLVKAITVVRFFREKASLELVLVSIYKPSLLNPYSNYI